MPKPVEQVTNEDLTRRSHQTDQAIRRTLHFKKVLDGEKDKLPWTTKNLPKAFDVGSAQNAAERQEIQERVEQAKTKIEQATMPILRVRERQVRVALEEATLQPLIDDRKTRKTITAAAYDIAKESYHGAVHNLMQPIRVLESKPTAEEDQPREKSKELPHAREQSLDALNLIIDNVLATPDQICAVLGPMRNGRPHGTTQTNAALRRAIGLAVHHVNEEDATPKEQVVFKKMQHYVETHGLFTPADMKSVVHTRLGIRASGTGTGRRRASS